MKQRSVSIAAMWLLVSFVVSAVPADIPRPALCGIVTDTSGRPLSGVRVDIATAAPRVGRGIFCPSCYLDCRKWDTTDSHGGFELSDLDTTLKFRLLVALPGYQTLQTELIDPRTSPVDLQLSPQPADIDSSRVLSGRVLATGAPVAGALVEPYGATTDQRRWYGRVDGVEPTVTDAEGRFQMLVPQPLQSLDIEVTAHGYCGDRILQLEPGQPSVDVSLTDGARVTGRVVRDGGPVAGMSVAVVQVDRSTDNGIFIAAVGDVTDAEGQFEFRHLPADQRYCIYSVAGEANRSDCPFILTVKTFAVPASGVTRDLGTLEATDPLTISGRVESADDQPLPQNLKLSFGRDPAWDLVSTTVATDGSFRIAGLPPETYAIRLGDRHLVLDASRIPFQILNEVSFGIHVQRSLSDLVIPVKRK